MSASAVLKLQKVGFSAEQVEALADFMDTQAASKADLAETKAELKADLAEVKAELKADMLAVGHRLESKIADVKSDLLKTIIGVMMVNSAVVLGAIFGLAKLLGH